jgi:single-strand DNA-binding protein
MNKIIIIGRLTKTPEFKTTSTGKNLCNFTVAVDKRIKPTDGSRTADFFNVTAWGAAADFVHSYLDKGRLVAVEGRMSSRDYTDKDGNPRTAWEVTADSVQGLDRPRDDAPQNPTPTKNSSKVSDEYDPFEDE